MTPMWQRMKAARFDARDVLAYLGMRVPPIDPWEIARLLEVEVREVEHPGWSGAMQSDATNAVAWLDIGEDRLLRRFTLAHELGHLMLHATGMLFRDISFDGSREEIEANMFARRLLMPPPMLHVIYTDLRDVERVAEIFEVPRTTMRLWLEHLCLA